MSPRPSVRVSVRVLQLNGWCPRPELRPRMLLNVGGARLWYSVNTGTDLNINFSSIS